LIDEIIKRTNAGVFQVNEFGNSEAQGSSVPQAPVREKRNPGTLEAIGVFILLLCFMGVSITVEAQTDGPPLTSKEVVALVYELPRHPEKRDEIVDTIRKRGIGFALTDGMRSVVATKSGNDPVLRRTLEEAERRRLNPAGSIVPSTEETSDLLERARASTLAAADAMPDFIVRQVIKRSVAYGNTGNWIPQDNLSIAVSFRANVGEEYKVLTVNGMPLAQDVTESKDYSKYVGNGASSSGVEYISALADIFKPESQTTFKPVDTDTVQGRRTIVYEFEVKRLFSHLTLSSGREFKTDVGSRGRLWLDRETSRVLRFEQIASEIPGNFPITAASSLIDYDWVAINEQKYLLPVRSLILITDSNRGQVFQSRNEIRFRGYQKYGAELKVIDEIDEKDFPPDPPEPAKPAPKKP
jgi:hypothetical protein